MSKQDSIIIESPLINWRDLNSNIKSIPASNRTYLVWAYYIIVNFIETDLEESPYSYYTMRQESFTTESFDIFMDLFLFHMIKIFIEDMQNNSGFFLMWKRTIAGEAHPRSFKKHVKFLYKEFIMNHFDFFDTI